MSRFVVSLLLVIVAIDAKTTRVTFGSCLFPGYDQSIFKHVVERKPDLWIFNGDNTYLDYKNWDLRDQFLVWREIFIGPPYKSVPVSEYDEVWNYTFADSKYYQQLTQQCPIIGILDDHDYGNNNCDVNNANKEAAKTAFLKYFDVPKDDIRYKRDGLYLYYPLNVTFDDNTNKTIDIILLDIRYFAHKNNTFDDILGEQQWQWLQDVLTNKLHHELLLIASPIPVLPSKRGHIGEQWYGGYPQSHKKLLTLLLPLLSDPNENVIFLTGDHHWAEIDHVGCVNDKLQYFEINEILSSGLTHTDVAFGDNFGIGLVYSTFWKFDREQIADCYEHGINFGEIEIEWTKKMQLDKIWMNVHNTIGDISCKYQYYPHEPHIGKSELNSILNQLQTNPRKVLYDMDGFMCFSEKYMNVSQFEEISFKIMELSIHAMIGTFPIILLIVVVCSCWCSYNRKAKSKTD